jgi:Integrase core domain
MFLSRSTITHGSSALRDDLTSRFGRDLRVIGESSAVCGAGAASACRLHERVALLIVDHVQAACQRFGVQQSMDRPGSALGNAIIESWHCTRSLGSVQPGVSIRATGRAKVAAWREDCNTNRRHSACHMLPPVTYEKKLAV